ncbi:pyridoxal-phosphate dependent enzyme [Myroides guanonis]|uniref:Threonine dehydratase n=1 Tax=Myroides guanonis TaxID=1150112 RepID=A0A1I3UZE9_9FLAO|nr:pyridoxal-phosphate dependent enzyme [Myroides guanonis]SFJ87247.1 threonine dehydratase [Myroides guanonis]
MRELLLECHERIKPFIHKTPIMESGMIENFLGNDLYFKCENFQRMGAFKMRAAVNAITQLTDEQRTKGVVTHSSGNFAQALALAARDLGVPAYIVVPSDAPEVKKNAILRYGGEVIECFPSLDARMRTANEIVEEKGVTFIHPSNDLRVIRGNATAAMEMLEIHPDLDILIVPVGGGGLLAGTALAAHYFGANIEVIGAEPLEADDAYRSLLSGKIEGNITTDTIADGLKTQLGDVNFPIIQEHVKRIILVRENEIVSAMRLIWERMKIIVEPSSAVALAALIKERQDFEGKKIGIILSGGNVDLNNLPFE